MAGYHRNLGVGLRRGQILTIFLPQYPRATSNHVWFTSLVLMACWLIEPEVWWEAFLVPGWAVSGAGLAWQVAYVRVKGSLGCWQDMGHIVPHHYITRPFTLILLWRQSIVSPRIKFTFAYASPGLQHTYTHVPPYASPDLYGVGTKRYGPYILVLTTVNPYRWWRNFYFDLEPRAHLAD